MDLLKYLMKNVKILTVDGTEITGLCHSFVGKADTEEGLYDEVILETKEHPYFGIDESKIKRIENIK